jgi:hypothetical protein
MAHVRIQQDWNHITAYNTDDEQYKMQDITYHNKQNAEREKDAHAHPTDLLVDRLIPEYYTSARGG